MKMRKKTTIFYFKGTLYAKNKLIEVDSEFKLSSIKPISIVY